MVRVGRDLKDHLVPTPLPWTGTSSTSPRCSELHPTWPWALPGRGHPQLLWTMWSRVSPLSTEEMSYVQTYSQFTTIVPCPITTCPSKKPVPIFLIGPLWILKTRRKSAQSLLFPRRNSPSSPSLSSQQRGSSPRTIAGASSGPAPPAPALSCAEGSRAGHRTPGGVSAERGRGAESPPSPCAHAAGDAAQGMVGFLGCEWAVPNISVSSDDGN